MIYFAVNFANLTISQAHNYNSLDLEMSLQNTKVCYMVVICFIGMIRTLCFMSEETSPLSNNLHFYSAYHIA